MNEFSTVAGYSIYKNELYFYRLVTDIGKRKKI